MDDNTKPIWFEEQTPVQEIHIGTAKTPKYQIFVATPVHSTVTIHYTQALLKFQQDCMQKGILVSFTLYKSSLVQQGRNLCVAEYLNVEKQYTHLLFIDSDIDFETKTIMTMLEKDKDIISAPYPMKWIDWDRTADRAHKLNITHPDELSKLGYTFPVKAEGMKELEVDDGVVEVTHAPTGCMLIKRKVFKDMIKKHPELEIHQVTMVNGQEIIKPNFYNLFECLHEPKTKKYYGEDFGFCKRWTDMGGKIYLYIMDFITHTGDYQFCGRFWDELKVQHKLKK